MKAKGALAQGMPTRGTSRAGGATMGACASIAAFGAVGAMLRYAVGLLVPTLARSGRAGTCLAYLAVTYATTLGAAALGFSVTA